MKARECLRFRRGLTLVETLVVVALVGLLLSLVVAAVMQTRRQSLRLLCAERQRTLSVALLLHHDSLGGLPQSKGLDSFWVKTLPFFDDAIANAGPVHVTLTTSEGTVTMVDGTVALPASWRFVCPAYSGDNSQNSVSLVGPQYVADVDPRLRCSYVGNQGSSPSPSSDPRRGVFGDWTAVRFKDIADGLSKTAMISEVTVWPNLSRKIASAYLEHIDSEATFVAQCKSPPPGEANGNFQIGQSWTWEMFSNSTYYKHLLTPGSYSCLGTASPNGGKATMTVTAGSEHDEMVNVVMCDGSLAATSYNIDEKIWQAMGSRDGGDVF